MDSGKRCRTSKKLKRKRGKGMKKMESEVKHQAEKAKHGKEDLQPYETPELTVYGKVETETLAPISL